MSKPIYLVTLHVSEQNLPTILGAIAGAATLVSVQPTQQAPEEATPKERHSYYVNGKRNKGIRGEELVLKVLQEKQRICIMSDFQTAFVAYGFAKHSCSPQLASLVKANRIRSLGNGKYCLPGTVITKSAAG